MNFEQGSVEYIKDMLENKSTAKQTTYKNVLSVFAVLGTESRDMVE